MFPGAGRSKEPPADTGSASGSISTSLVTRTRKGDEPTTQSVSFRARYFKDRLEADCVLVAFSGQPLVTLSPGYGAYTFFKLIMSDDREEQDLAELWESIPTPDRDALDYENWTKRLFVSAHRSPAALYPLLQHYVTALDAVESTNQASRRSVKTLYSFAYPLTVLRMALVVFAIGHLLRNQPADKDAELEHAGMKRAARTTLYSLAIVGALSSLDLVWTILAASANQMHELNPLGSRLIQSPLALIGFKASSTFVAVGLLAALRKHHIAQVTSWWACLLCTLLAVRWLVFNSLFVA